MVKSEELQFTNGREADDVDQNSDDEESVEVSSNSVEARAHANSSITRRLTEIFLVDSDDDLLLQMSNREDGVLHWLRALDMQVMGACRADERLKSSLKLNVSTGVPEDRLPSHLSQHFEPSEIGLLAMCLCVPLVSIRVGKINKQGTLLSPTSVRGNLCLTLLPTSDLHLSFHGDDGSRERLATLSSETLCSAVEIEEISADKSGRSFLIKTADSMVSYFWCSEKSELLGNELLRKMKDLLMRKPSLAELSAISEERLNCFATQLRAYLARSMVTSSQVSDILSAQPLSDAGFDPSEYHCPRSSFNGQKSSHFQQYGSQGPKINLMGSLRLKSNSVKNGLPKSLYPGMMDATENLRQEVGNYVPFFDSLSLASGNSTHPSCSVCFEKDTVPDLNAIHPFVKFNLLGALGKSAEPPLSGPKIQVPFSGPSNHSPHYCWCPPVASTLQYMLGSSQLSIPSTESLSLPPLSSLLSATGSSSLSTSKPSLNLTEVPPADFPSLLSKPSVRMPTLQQIPTFTPLICEPIVHIPMIDVCSSGPGYLVSAGPVMPTTIPPLNSNLGDPVHPNAESMVEKSARETLHMLVSSSNQPSQQMFQVLPSVTTSSNDNGNIPATGSRGLYCGSAVSCSMSTLGFLFHKSSGGGIGKGCPGKDDSIRKMENPPSSNTSSFDA